MVKKLSSVCDNPEREIRLMLQNITGKDPRLPQDKLLTNREHQLLTDMVNKRLERVPLQYLLKEWEFMGIPLQVGKGVLCPRPDSECLVEYAIECLKNRSCSRVLDLCAGTGALGLAIKRFVPDCHVTSVERYKAAFNYLEKNVSDEVSVVLEDLHTYHTKLKDESLDLLICNPPYIPKSERSDLAPELSYEPATALFEPSELYFYKKVVDLYSSKISSGGYIIFEVPTGKERDVADILADYNFSTEFINDYNHTIRGVSGIKK